MKPFASGMDVLMCSCRYRNYYSAFLYFRLVAIICMIYWYSSVMSSLIHFSFIVCALRPLAVDQVLKTTVALSNSVPGRPLR